MLPEQRQQRPGRHEAPFEGDMLEDLIVRSGRLDWLNTDAGALILMPLKLRRHWSGNEPPKDGRTVDARFRWNPSRPATDYDRACDVEGLVGLVPVGPGVGLVLGQDPLPTAWQALESGGGLLARLYTCETGYPTSIPVLSEELRWDAAGELSADGSPFVLFDSTEAGDEEPIFPFLTIDLPEGRYVVETAAYRDRQMELWLVRLRPRQGQGPHTDER